MPEKAEKSEAAIIIKKKRHKGHGGSHSSSWKIAFADFAVAMMAFFLLMWILAATTEAEKQAITGYFSNPLAPISGESAILLRDMYSLTSPKQYSTTEVGRSALEGFLKEEQGKTNENDEDVAEIAKSLADSIRSGELEIDVKTDRIVIRILENGSFESGSADLLPAFAPVLKKVAKVLQITPGKIIVSGYTDNVPIQTPVFRSNRELSVVRAVSVAEELLQNKKIESERFVIHGYGENQALAPNDTPANKAKNRRVELELLQGQEPANKGKVITIEKDADTKLLPNIEKIDRDDFSVFPPITEVDFDGNGEYLESSELGVYDKDVLYNYELTDKVVKPTAKPKDDTKPDVVDSQPLAKDDAKKDAVPANPADVTKDTPKTKTTKTVPQPSPTAEPKQQEDLGLFKSPASEVKQDKKPDDLGIFTEKEVQEHDDLGIVKQAPPKQPTAIQVDKDVAAGH